MMLSTALVVMLECEQIHCIGLSYLVISWAHFLICRLHTYIIHINSLHHSQISDGTQIPVHIIDMHIAHESDSTV